MLRYMTAGESHGKGLMAVLEGLPAGLKLDKGFINGELVRRMKGYGRGGRMSIEKDTAEIISGCRRGNTIGSPVGMLIWNRDSRIDKMPKVSSPRPGHADLAGMIKYGFDNARDVLERASARETAARVAVGAVVKLLLGEFGITVASHVTMIGEVCAETGHLSFAELVKAAERSNVRCADKKAARLMRSAIDMAGKEGNTLGGAFEVIADGVPPGLGSYVHWDRRLDGNMARAVMSIPAVKAVSIGTGIESASLAGSEVHDEIVYEKNKKSFKRLSNNAGGVEGGVTNGEQIVVKGFMKPIATLAKPLRSVNVSSKKESRAARVRADILAVPACGVVAEAALALEIASSFLEKFGRDSMGEIKRGFSAYLKDIRKR